MVGLIVWYVIGSILGAIGWFMWRGASALVNGPEQLPEWEQAAGRIHLFAGDRYFNSSNLNAYQHDALNWSDGRIGCGFWHDLQLRPELQPALIGTIQIFKPVHQKGQIAVILDNGVLNSLGLPPVGLNSSAQDLVIVENSGILTSQYGS